MVEAIFQSLVSLSQQRRWSDIMEITNRQSSAWNSVDFPPWFWFFHGEALLKTGRVNDAMEALCRGLKGSPENRWGNKVYFDAQIAAGQYERAFSSFKQFIESGSERESEKAWYVEKASELSYFEIAAKMNATRKVVDDINGSPRYALALQCFIKADTLERVLDTFNFLDSSNEFSLVILQDSCAGAELKHDRSREERIVREVLGRYLPALTDRFFSVQVLKNTSNRGTAPSCKRLLDHVAETHEGFLFVEDDCLLDRSALEWTRYHLENNINAEGSWFVSCESIFFDAAGRDVSEEDRRILLEVAKNDQLSNSFTYIDFVPSTCFATRSELWRLCSNVRSFTRGPESLNRLMALFGRKTISSVVPRASDIGMMHELGYSVDKLGKNDVKEHKSTLFLPQATFNPQLCTAFPGDTAELFQGSSELNRARIDTLRSRYIPARLGGLPAKAVQR